MRIWRCGVWACGSSVRKAVVVFVLAHGGADAAGGSALRQHVRGVEDALRSEIRTKGGVVAEAEVGLGKGHGIEAIAGGGVARVVATAWLLGLGLGRTRTWAPSGQILHAAARVRV